MIWNINLIGKDKAELSAAISREQYIPEGLKELFYDQINRINLEGANLTGYGIAVRSDGHCDDHYCFGNFKVEKIRIV